MSELHQKLVIEAKLPSSTDPWSHPDFTSSSFSSSPSNVVKCHIDQIILVLEKSYFHPLIGGPQTTEEELEMGRLPTYGLAIRWPYASFTLNTLLNRQAHANMSIYVVDTSDIG